eukprot:231782-Hanusia_phi.AAC.1
MSDRTPHCTGPRPPLTRPERGRAPPGGWPGTVGRRTVEPGTRPSDHRFTVADSEARTRRLLKLLSGGGGGRRRAAGRPDGATRRDPAATPSDSEAQSLGLSSAGPVPDGPPRRRTAALRLPLAEVRSPRSLRRVASRPPPCE